MNRARRFFTPYEANALLRDLLPRIEELVGQIQLARTLSGIGSSGGPQARSQAQLQLHQLKQRAQDSLDAILATGVQVKGLEPALLDFPALRDGQEVYLSWREGEPVVTHWHLPNTGYQGRVPLGEDLACWEWFS